MFLKTSKSDSTLGYSVLTVKQEAFCQSFVENGGNASDAYRVSYNVENMKAESIHRKAKELMDNGKIAARIAELRSAILKRHDLTIDDIIAELEEARELAKTASTPNVNAMVAASMGKAKVAGLIKDRTEVTGADGSPLAMNLQVSFIGVKGSGG